jgi:mitogen-activated protein kinase kinase kinase
LAVYRAPEVLDSNNNKRGYDSKVDIWSVGCVVLEMWTGERPWAGEEMIPVMMKVMLPPYKIPLAYRDLSLVI